MEQSELVDATLEVFREAADKHPETRLAIQANLRRTPTDLDAMAAIKPRIRLVKGPMRSRSTRPCSRRRRSPRSSCT